MDQELGESHLWRTQQVTIAGKEVISQFMSLFVFHTFLGCSLFKSFCLSTGVRKVILIGPVNMDRQQTTSFILEEIPVPDLSVLTTGFCNKCRLAVGRKSFPH